MGKIFCLMGKSSSGKDTIFKQLSEEQELGLKTIVPYTTRPIRNGEKDGTEYYFVTDEKLTDFERLNQIIELRAYDTCLGTWKYFTAADNQIDLEKNNYIVIGTLESFQKTRSYFGKDKVLPIYIQLDDGARLQRAIDRERVQESPKYEEMCRRFLADAKDFSETNLMEAGIETVFCNEELEHCLKEIKQFILKHL